MDLWIYGVGMISCYYNFCQPVIFHKTLSRALAKPFMDNILLSTVDKDAGEKGTPFPRIPGPSPEDKVCIVGAGPAGLHMAVELRRRNYNNIVILEKSNRVGGKCYDVHRTGGVNALGALYVTEEFF